MGSQSSSPRRSERVAFETASQLIVGDVTLPADGYRSRFSDAVNRDDVDFIRLVNVVITPLDGGEPEMREFAMLGKAHVRLAYPVEG